MKNPEIKVPEIIDSDKILSSIIVESTIVLRKE